MRELELPDVQDVMLEYRKIKLLYRSALKEIGTKLEILNDEFKLVHQYNPIEHIESRLKTDESTRTFALAPAQPRLQPSTQNAALYALKRPRPFMPLPVKSVYVKMAPNHRHQMT